MRTDRPNVPPRVLFIGGARYSAPLDETSRKKFEALTKVADVEVIGFNRAGLRPPYIFTDCARFFVLPAPRWPLLRYVIFFSVGTAFAIFRVLWSSREVLVVQSPYEGVVGVWAKGIGRLLGRHVALVVESHGDFEVSLFLQRSLRLGKLYRRIMGSFARVSIANADIVRAVSDSTASQLREWGASVPLIKFMTWTDIEPFLAVGRERSRVDLPSSGQDVLFVGALVPRKGLLELIRAFRLVREEHTQRARLLLAGPETIPSYAQNVKDLVVKEGLSDRAEFLGELSQDELAKLMRGVVLFVLPSYSEGLPRVVVEAMAAGTPVVATSVSGIPEAVVDGETGLLVPPGDVRRLAEAVIRILSHPEEAVLMGEAGHLRAQRLFSPEAYVGGYKQIFAMATDVLESGGAS